jgi:excisionase family DNA binding protein
MSATLSNSAPIMPNQLLSEPWWDAEDAAAHTKIPARTIRHLFQTRKIKASKLGSMWRTKRSWVDAALEQNAVTNPKKSKPLK